MPPFTVATVRFLLDQPTVADTEDIACYCTDPVFETSMTTPWPYRLSDARFFVEEHVPRGWADDSEWTWAIRETDGGPLLGVIGVRLTTGIVGYWLGAPHRGRGVMTEALAAVIEAVFARTALDELLWECVIGNRASSRVAQKTGFRFTGQRLGLVVGRDGSRDESWTASLRRDDQRDAVAGWPA